MAAVVGLEQSRSLADLVRVLEALQEWLPDPRDAELKSAFAEWVRRLAKRLAPAGGEELPPARTLEDVRMNLEERVAQWPKEWLAQGLEHERASCAIWRGRGSERTPPSNCRRCWPGSRTRIASPTSATGSCVAIRGRNSWLVPPRPQMSGNGPAVEAREGPRALRMPPSHDRSPRIDCPHPLRVRWVERSRGVKQEQSCLAQ